MKTTEMLKRIQTLLNTRVELEDRKLDNGTVISADEFAEGQPVFIVTEDERIPMPVGEYVMEDGSMLVVEEEGVIGSIQAAEEEVEEVEQEVVEEEMSNEVKEPKKVVESTVVETHFSEEQKSELVETILSSVSPLIEELQNKVNELETKLSQEVEEEVQVEEKLSADVKEEKLSKTFKHSPEVKGEQARPRFNNGRVANTTLQRVFQRISNK
jgi:hypothetical protein